MPSLWAAGDRLRRLEQALALTAFAWVAARTVRAMHAAWAYTQDDAYVTLRYSRNLAEGHGLVWNIGETIPVEGYSNFLYVLVGATAIRLGIDPVIVLKWLGCLVVAPTCCLLYVLARRWRSPLPAVLPAVLLTLQLGETAWAVSAMETTVFQLFVVAATTAFVLGLDAPMTVDATAGRLARLGTRGALHQLSAALCFLASVTRPEGPILVLLLALTAGVDMAVARRKARKTGDLGLADDARRAFIVSLKAFVWVFLAPSVLYHGWRIAHFGRLFPNTVYCKRVFASKEEGPWVVVTEFWKQSKVYVLLALVQDPRKLGAKALPLFLLPLAYVGILYHADDIVADFSRHFLAALALLVVASAMGMDNLAAMLASPVRWVFRRAVGGSDGALVVSEKALVVLACLALYARGQRWVDDARPRKCAFKVEPDEGAWLLTRAYDLAYHASCYAERKEPGRRELGRYVEKTLSPEQSFVLGDVGLVGYLTHAGIIDAYCLNTPELTRPPIDYDPKKFIDSIFDRAPAAIVVHSLTPPPNLFPQPIAYKFYDTLLQDPRFKQLYAPTPKAPSFWTENYGLVYCERRKP
jgi:hypothetical protein